MLGGSRQQHTQVTLTRNCTTHPHKDTLLCKRKKIGRTPRKLSDKLEGLLPFLLQPHNPQRVAGWQVQGQWESTNCEAEPSPIAPNPRRLNLNPNRV